MIKFACAFMSFLVAIAVGCGSAPGPTPVPTRSVAARAAVTFAPTIVPTLPGKPTATAAAKPSATATRPSISFPIFSSPATGVPSPTVRVLRIGHVGYPDVLDPQKASTILKSRC